MFSLGIFLQVTSLFLLFLFPGQPPGALDRLKSTAGSRVTCISGTPGFPFDYNQVLTIEDKALKEWQILRCCQGRSKFNQKGLISRSLVLAAVEEREASHPCPIHRHCWSLPLSLSLLPPGNCVSLPSPPRRKEATLRSGFNQGPCLPLAHLPSPVLWSYIPASFFGSWILSWLYNKCIKVFLMTLFPIILRTILKSRSDHGMFLRIFPCFGVCCYATKGTLKMTEPKPRSHRIYKVITCSSSKVL